MLSGKADVLVPLMKAQSAGACPEYARYLHRRPIHPIDRIGELRPPLHGEFPVLDASLAEPGLIRCPESEFDGSVDVAKVFGV